MGAIFYLKCKRKGCTQVVLITFHLVEGGGGVLVDLDGIKKYL